MLFTYLFPVAAVLGSCVSVAACVPPVSSGRVASTYFAGYHADDYPVSSMQWTKYTDAKWAFAETRADGSLDLTSSSPDKLPSWVSAAKSNGVKAQISIGGWSGSRFFSTSIGSAENRTAFVKQCLKLVSQYQVDGLDFDFEYPNRQGLGCNTINANDTPNFLSFLQELRADPAGKKLLLTAAGSLYPWNDPSGTSSSASALSGFAAVLDYISIMNYDVYGPWTTTGGPNAPLEMSCDARNTQGGGKEGVQKWINAGIPAKKLVLAVAAYGHGFSVNASSAFPNGKSEGLNMYPPQNATHRFKGSKWDDDPPVDVCGNANPPSGTFQFWSLITETGFVDAKGEPALGVPYGYDDCSQTPAVYSEKSEIWVSYDNARSFKVKGQYIKSAGLAGFALWEAGGDYNNTLVDAVRAGAGFA